MSDFDPKILGGSIKRGIVNPDLLEERALSSRGESTSKKEIEADDNPKYKQKWR